MPYFQHTQVSRMKTKLIKILTPFAVLPLLACGQPAVSNANAAPTQAAKAEAPADKSVAASLKHVWKSLCRPRFESFERQ